MLLGEDYTPETPSEQKAKKNDNGGLSFPVFGSDESEEVEIEVKRKKEKNGYGEEEVEGDKVSTFATGLAAKTQKLLQDRKREVMVVF